MLEYDEKRDYIRMETNCKMTYRFVDSSQLHEATCLNLSGAGLLFITDQKVDIGQALEATIYPGIPITPPVVAFIEVIRSNPTANQDGYQLAATIKGIKGR